jgi:hypothetical protein
MSFVMQEWDGEDTRPTSLFLWSHAKQVTGRAKQKYREYSDALELMSQFQVTVCKWSLSLFFSENLNQS